MSWSDLGPVREAPLRSLAPAPLGDRAAGAVRLPAPEASPRTASGSRSEASHWKAPTAKPRSASGSRSSSAAPLSHSLSLCLSRFLSISPVSLSLSLCLSVSLSLSPIPPCLQLRQQTAAPCLPVWLDLRPARRQQTGRRLRPSRVVLLASAPSRQSSSRDALALMCGQSVVHGCVGDGTRRSTLLQLKAERRVVVARHPGRRGVHAGVGVGQHCCI